ncbi:hypothetical protein BGP_3424 [Beggiatoa sp. PS]|nr:hypothetical protein BGP_3424 [Beggiatoa sp. PS]
MIINILNYNQLSSIGFCFGTYGAKYFCYSIFAFNALQRYSVFYFIINHLNYINSTLFNRELL